MPLYYFNLYNDDVTLDDEGVDLPDNHSARAHGIKEARALAAATVSSRPPSPHRSIGTVRFDEAVQII